MSILAREPAAPPEPAGNPPRLKFRERSGLWLKLSKLRLKEWLAFDSALSKKAVGLACYLAARLCRARGDHRRAFQLLSKLHRGDFLALAKAEAERVAREAAAHAARGEDDPVLSLYREHIDGMTTTPRTEKFFEDPTKLLGPLAMVLKSHRSGEKGVLLLLYSHTFPLFAHLFDLQAIAERYYVVLEPDWSGFCDPNTLSYSQYHFPVFVQASEPRDIELITGLRSNLIAVPTSNNWWVDHRLFRPLAGAAKNMDVVMIAGWGEYKRHHMFFRALARLRRAGHTIRVLLLGYPVGFTREDILCQASYYGVADQLEVHEWVPYDRMNELLNRAKVHVLWSRKEGAPRAIIEGMFSGLPCILREGFNYGYPYHHINEQTGCFAGERDLPDKLLWMIERAPTFTPRQWVAEHMSAQRATEILSEVIGSTAAARGELWRGGLAVKVNKLHGMEYWDPRDQHRFADDYDFLLSAQRGTATPTSTSESAPKAGRWRRFRGR
jgi:glycosyltransferase involved in cell wall biosynthesis